MPSYAKRQTKSGTVIDVRFRIMNDAGVEVQKRLCGYPNKRAAEQAYMEFMKTYTPPVFKAAKNTKYSFDELFSLYRKKMEAELAVSSNYDVNWIFDKYITPYFYNREIPALTKADYSAWQTELWATKNPKTGKFYAQKYLTKIRSVFMSFLNWCEETYDIPNAFKMIRKPKRKEMKAEMQFWELDEFLSFSEAVDDIFWKTFFMGLFYSGCRVGEMLALSDNDVYLVEGNYCFNICKNLTRKTMNTEDKFLISAPKTASSNRTVILPDVMTKQIKLYLEYKKSNDVPGAFFFGGERPVPQRTYQRYFENYTKKAGDEKKGCFRPKLLIFRSFYRYFLMISDCF